MKRPTLAIIVAAATLFAAMTAASAADGSDMLTDGRDGKTYKTAEIGGKRWMAENLNYQTPSGSWCYENDNFNCDKYGRLYNWSTAGTACPAGFHLPSHQEWHNLAETVGGKSVAGKKFKAQSGWNKYGNGTDNVGFSALPGGYRNSIGTFSLVGNGGYWWTATESGSGDANYRIMFYDYDYVRESNEVKRYAFSVRCIED